MLRKLGYLATSLVMVFSTTGFPANADDGATDEIALPDLPSKNHTRVASSLLPLTSSDAVKLGGQLSAPLVEVEIMTSSREATTAFVTAAGGKVTYVLGSTVWAEVPADRIRGLSEVEGVGFVDTPARPFPLGDISQGVGVTNADMWHDDGANGSGVRVAIVDLGFFGYQDAIASGDLPAVTTKNFCGSGNFQGTEHGTGVAEIVHDMAPGAQIYLICVSSVADLDKAVDFALANGIDVINHSVGWWNTSRGDGSGGPDTPVGIANRAVNSGIVWVQASGNHADRHWKGTYNDATGNGFHDFDPGADETNAFLLGPGQTVAVFLKWDKWPTTNLDYDLGLYEHLSGGGIAFRASSVNEQTGSQPPTEEIIYTNTTGSTKVMGAAIDKFDGNGSPRMDLFITSSELQYQVKASSIVEPSGAPKVVTVGATCWSNDKLASYSSRGPNIAGQKKPDVSAPTGVDTWAYGPGNTNCGAGFTGTSSSSPHVAGMAALILDTAPNLSPGAVKTRLMTHTVDLGGKGKDNLYGAGRINAFGLCNGKVPTILGNGAKNKINGTSKADVIHGYGKADTIDGKGGNDLICGGPGADKLEGGGGKDTLRGDEGPDELSGGPANDKLIGGAGDNTATYESSGGKVVVDLLSGESSGAQGADTLTSITTVVGSAFNDVLRGSSGSDELIGGNGNDTLIGRAGLDVLSGGAGADDLIGGGGDDDLSGQGGEDSVDGGPDNDTVAGGSGNDTLFGRDGDDLLLGGGGEDEMLGGDGSDVIRGQNQNDELFGHGGDDTLDGGPGADDLDGGAGLDTLFGGTGPDTIDGGAGDDLVSYEGAGGGVTVDLSGGTATGAWGNDILSFIEKIFGSLFDDTLTGDDFVNVIDGSSGDDTVFGLGGDDHLIGGPGTDTADGGDGTDVCETFENLTSC